MKASLNTIVAVFGTLLAVLYIVEGKMPMGGKAPRTPRNRQYIKTSSGIRRIQDTHYSLVSTTENGKTRHLAEGEIRCRLWQNCIIFQDDRGDQHRWECVFTDSKFAGQIGGNENRRVSIRDVPSTNEFLEVNGAESGSTDLVLSFADIDDHAIQVDYNDIIGVEYNPEGRDNENTGDENRGDGRVGGGGGKGGGLKRLKIPNRNRRQLGGQTMGEMKTLVVRVSTNDSSPSDNAAQISSDVFADDWCLKSQYAKCSYNQLIIVEYEDGEFYGVNTDAPGLIELQIDTNAFCGGAGQDACPSNTDTISDDMQNLANAGLRALFGDVDPGTLFDLVLFCMPPTTASFLAYAYINRWDSYYYNDWCSAMSSQMHEVGHNIGLHHSGEYVGDSSTLEYGDQSDMMGFSYKSDDNPRMCFNPAKNWQLGWYSDGPGGERTLELVPSEITNTPQQYTINGVVDYDTGSGLIVIKIGDFYVGYNKQADFNSGVQEDGNKIQVTEKLGDAESSTKSKAAARLSVGQSFSIPITSVLNIGVKFVSISSDNTNAVIEINSVGEAPECVGEKDKDIEVSIITDSYPGETSWVILDPLGVEIYKGGPYSSPRSTSIETVPGLCSGVEYYFVIQDTFGDGICCQWGNGNWKATFLGDDLFDGTNVVEDFEDSYTVPFTLPVIAEPTFAPTDAPTGRPTFAPTNQPTAAPVEPTNPPTTTPEVNPQVGSCQDTPFYLYKGKSGKGCDWIKSKDKGGKENTAKKICLRKDGDKRVWEYCRQTCHAAAVNKLNDECGFDPYPDPPIS